MNIDPGFVERMKAIRAFDGEYNSMTRRLLTDCYAEGGGENVVLSPLSIMLLLAVASDATAGKTRIEILRALGSPVAAKALSVMQEMLCRDPAFTAANALCIRKDHASGISEEFRELLKQKYDGELFASEKIAEDVNRWVTEKTKGMIRNAVPDGIADAVACLINAVAFESEWKNPYESNEIFQKDFHNADGTVNPVEMMECFVYRYIDAPDYTGFVKQYRNSGFSFMGLLPRDTEAGKLPAILCGTDFSRMHARQKSQKVYTGIPEFTFEYEKELTTLFGGLGISELFSANADLSPVSPGQLVVQSVMHKAFIDVNRKGTRAAAVTAMCADESVEEEEKYEEVILDRPFVFAIMHDRTSTPVFTGVVTNL